MEINVRINPLYAMGKTKGVRYKPLSRFYSFFIRPVDIPEVPVINNDAVSMVGSALAQAVLGEEPVRKTAVRDTLHIVLLTYDILDYKMMLNINRSPCVKPDVKFLCFVEIFREGIIHSNISTEFKEVLCIALNKNPVRYALLNFWKEGVRNYRAAREGIL